MGMGGVFSSVAQSRPTPSDPMDCSTPAFPVHHQLPELARTDVHWVGDSIQPSHPLSSPSPPAFNLSQHQGPFQWVASSHQVAKVLKLQHQSFQWIFRIDSLYWYSGWFDLLAVQGVLKSLLQHQFKSINSWVLSLLYGPPLTSVHDLSVDLDKLSVCLCVLSWAWLSNTTDCSPPGSSVRGIFQARILERVAISPSRGSSPPRDPIPDLLPFNHWVTWEAPGVLRGLGIHFHFHNPRHQSSKKHTLKNVRIGWFLTRSRTSSSSEAATFNHNKLCF